MKIICISASNTKLTDERSSSVRVCNIMKDIIQKEIKGDIQVEVIALRDYDMKPCNLCGECFKSGKCIMDEKFKNGVCFGLKDDTCIQSTTDSVFPDIIQDWNAIEERIYPFVRKAIEEISNKKYMRF